MSSTHNPPDLAGGGLPVSRGGLGPTSENDGVLQHVVVDRADDPRLADYIGLRDQELRRATEARGGLFIAEGINVLRRLLTSSYQVRSIVLGPHRYESLGVELSASVRPETPVYVVPRDVLVEVAGFDIHRGVVASAERGVPGSLATVSMSSGPIINADVCS